MSYLNDISYVRDGDLVEVSHRGHVFKDLGGGLFIRETGFLVGRYDEGQSQNILNNNVFSIRVIPTPEPPIDSVVIFEGRAYQRRFGNSWFMIGSSESHKWQDIFYRAEILEKKS